MFLFWYLLGTQLNTLSLVAPPKKEMCFSHAKTRKNLDFFEMHTYLKPGAQKLLRHNWRKLKTASFHFRCVGEKVASFVVMCFFVSVSVFRLKLFRSALLRTRLQLDSKSHLTTNGLILRFPWKIASCVDFISVWTEICKNCSVFFIFWRHDFWLKLRGILVCSLKMLVLFSHRFL